MSGHSPGPWHWEMMGDGQWWLLSTEFVPGSDAGFVLRADPNEGALPADAALIAAAPGLLAMLKVLHPPHPPAPRCDACALITRAEGTA